MSTRWDAVPREGRPPAAREIPLDRGLAPAAPAGELARERLQALSLAVVLTLAACAVPSWWGFAAMWRESVGGADAGPVLSDSVLLLLGLALALPERRRSGLCIGRLRPRWRMVLLVCGAPVVLAALVYPRLPVQPFAGTSWGMWGISPLAQDLLFMGFLYGYLERLFPGYLHPRLPVRAALPLAAVFFSAWHLPNFFSMPAGYVCFQLAYTWAGFVLTGLSRQWTGSMLYAWLSHALVNFVAWSTG